jgi:hypothetical protein
VCVCAFCGGERVFKDVFAKETETNLYFVCLFVGFEERQLLRLFAPDFTVSSRTLFSCYLRDIKL